MEYMPAFDMHRPATAKEAVAAFTPGSRYLGGGTDLVVNIRRGIEAPGAVIDLTAIAEMKGVAATADGLRIGAATTLAALAADPLLTGPYDIVAQAAGDVAGPTHRQMGTVGGNLCLDTRCIFYNQSEWWRQANDYCLKKGGEICHVARSGSYCWAAFSGDLAPALLVLDANVEIEGPDGARIIPLAELYGDDGRTYLRLAPGELLVAVHVPTPPANLTGAYEKARVRKSIEFPLCGAAVAMVRDGDNVTGLRVALTGTAPRPIRLTGTDAFHGKPFDDDAADALTALVRKQATPMRTTFTAVKYRRRVVAALAKRAALGLAGH